MHIQSSAEELTFPEAHMEEEEGQDQLTEAQLASGADVAAASVLQVPPLPSTMAEEASGGADEEAPHAGDDGGGASMKMLAIAFLVLNFCVRADLATLESLGTCVYRYLHDGSLVCTAASTLPPLPHRHANPSGGLRASSLFYTYVGLIGLLCFFVVYVITHKKKQQEERPIPPHTQPENSDDDRLKEPLLANDDNEGNVTPSDAPLQQALAATGATRRMPTMACERPHVSDRVLLLFGLAVTTVGNLLLIGTDPGEPGTSRSWTDLSLWRFELGFVLAWAVGYPCTQTVVVSALSKVLPKSQQGKWMGRLASAGSLGRVLCPVVAGTLYSASTSGGSYTGWLSFALVAGLMAIATLAVARRFEALRERS